MVPGLRVLARARPLYGEDAPLIFVAVRFDAACQKRVCRVARNAEIRRESNGQAGKRSCPMAWYARLSRVAELFRPPRNGRRRPLSQPYLQPAGRHLLVGIGAKRGRRAPPSASTVALGRLDPTDPSRSLWSSLFRPGGQRIMSS